MFITELFLMKDMQMPNTESLTKFFKFKLFQN